MCAVPDDPQVAATLQPDLQAVVSAKEQTVARIPFPLDVNAPDIFQREVVAGGVLCQSLLWAAQNMVRNSHVLFLSLVLPESCPENKSCRHEALVSWSNHQTWFDASVLRMSPTLAPCGYIFSVYSLKLAPNNYIFSHRTKGEDASNCPCL